MPNIIDENKIENTQIVITTKTLWTVVIALVTAASSLYGLLKSDISDVKDDVIKVDESVGKVIEKLEVYEIKPMQNDIKRHERDIGTILGRTNSRYEDYTTNSGPNSNHMPTSTPIE